MTAKTASRFALEGFWGTLRTLRDQWVLIVFFGTALFWVRDHYDQFMELPPRLAELQRDMDEVRGELVRLDKALVDPEAGRGPVLNLTGTRHAITDGAPGSRVAVTLETVQVVRDDCKASDFGAFMIDASGKWYSVTTDLERMLHVVNAQDIAFEVWVHPRMQPGRARFLIEVTYTCAQEIRVVRSPVLPFRVLGSHQQ